MGDLHSSLTRNGAKDVATVLFRSPWWVVVGLAFAVGGFVTTSVTASSHTNAMRVRLDNVELVLDERTDILTVIQVNQRDVMRSLCEIKRFNRIVARETDCEANLPRVIMPRSPLQMNRQPQGQRP